MKRTAKAIWTGDVKQGKGALTTESGILNNTPYSYTTRFEGAKGTNPEELIAAAHAGCFTMATSAFLSKEGFPPENLSTTAALDFEQIDGNWTITTIHLEMTGKVPKINEAKFQEIVKNAKENCPVSRLMNAKIILEAKLQS